MNFRQIEDRAYRKIRDKLIYRYCYYLEYDYSILTNILKRKRNGSRSDIYYSTAYIMLDTETSKRAPTEYDKEGKPINQVNHLCAWTISIRAFHMNLCTLRGSRPDELVHCLSLIRKNMEADVIFMFVHNLPYDWMFIRRFLLDEFGKPKSQLNIKNHYPISIQFENGIVLRDSLILAGVSLEKWADNLGVEHQKATGSWDYDKIRDQRDFINLNDDELLYIEHDTLAGVECLNKLADNLKDTVVSLPYTLTGIVRRDMRREGRAHYAKQIFNRQLLTWKEYQILEKVFHGGFTHANRHIVNWIRKRVKCKDFKSSYPYCMLTAKVPAEQFYHMDGNMDPRDILKASDRSYIFKLVMINPRLKDPYYPMPALQFYKCDSSINAITDNGRILSADYVEIYMNEIDLKIIDKMYICDSWIATDIMTALNDYIPKWFRDEVFKIFREKCELEYEVKVLKSADPSVYNLKKANLNSLYGMSVTKAVKPEITEVYDDDPVHELISGDYFIEDTNLEKEFDNYNKKRDNVLPYVYGVYTTSYAMLHLFELSECIDDINHHWIYSDTDSIYSDNWNEDKLEAYNERVKHELLSAGYGPVIVKDKEYWLGVAEDDGDYDRFITQGAKRYAVEKDGKIKITVSGVPKSTGSACLSSLEDFREGFIFPGADTGKMTHTYIYSDIHEDERGNICADSIDLTPADYILSSVDMFRFKDLFLEEVTYDFYEEE